MKPIVNQAPSHHPTTEHRTQCTIEEKHEDDSDSENDIDYKQSLR